MRFDDRIRTVLDHPVADDRDRAVRWRQLIDLLSRARPDSDPELVERALDTARADRETVPAAVRAATARSIAGRPVDNRLVALFASDKLEVAAPLLAAATLDEKGRAEVAAVASDEVKRLFFALGNFPLPDALPETPAEPLELTERAEPPSIGEMVARIERLRRSDPPEELRTEPAPSPTQKEAASPRLFRWECDPAGTVLWVEGAPRAALIGRALAGHEGEALVGEDHRGLLVRRSPFLDLPMNPAPALGGDWRVSGAPAFTPGEGRFVGYRGISRRIDEPPPPRGARKGRKGRAGDAHSIRELVHEIKTPLNAIIGFAEIIDGQFLGPAHRSYRQRAASIVSQARLLLAAVEDLDLAARLQNERRGATIAGTEFADIFPRAVEQLNAYGAPRGIGVVYTLEGRFTRCALEPELAERMASRFMTSVVDAASDGEALSVHVAPVKGKCGVAVHRPQALRGVPDSDLFDARFGADDKQPIGLGFAFRLVRGLAQTVGGDLITDAERLILLLPAKR